MNISAASTFTPTLLEPREALGDASLGISELNKSEEDTKTQTSSETGDKKLNELTTSERQQVSELQQRDTEVRAHEAAHIAAGGSAISGGASFTYQKGPDSKQYAVGGEVPISASGGNTPEEKIALARQVQAGALAPANPSPQDLKVASSAALMEAQARQDLAIERSEEQKQKATGIYEDNENETALTDETPTIELFA